VHDEAAPAQRHRARDDLREAERPNEVHGEHGVEVLAVGLEQRPQRHGPERARGVDEDVEAAMSRAVKKASQQWQNPTQRRTTSQRQSFDGQVSPASK